MSTLTWLQEKEWSMGNGQCPECYGVSTDWLGHPLHLTAASIGHKTACRLAAGIKELGGIPVYVGKFESPLEYEIDWSGGFLTTLLKRASLNTEGK